jgi:hypothetical protein
MSDVEMYDPSCDRIDVSIKAIWLLYRRGRWDLLATFNVTRARFERAFEAFDDRYIRGQGVITTPTQVNRLLQMAGPGLVGCALAVLELYQYITKETRQEHYTTQFLRGHV